MSKRQRINPFDRSTAEWVLFERYRRATLAGQAAARARDLAATEADAYFASAEHFAQALRALGHGDKIPGQQALPKPAA